MTAPHSYQAACEALGLLGDDNEWDIAMQEACASAMSSGKSILLGGDFRQTLLVKKGASKMEILASCISQSNLWPHFRVFTLTEDMQLLRPDVSADERSLITFFASWLLDIGDGKTGEADQQDPKNTSWIDIPLTYHLPDNEQGFSNLIDVSPKLNRSFQPAKGDSQLV
ncbi:DNA helicase [Tanacetum coccineum]